ncbi:pectinesterase family protein [Nonomuraea sp. NPDC050691]|uniref:pectinesterase family protein n=1 Tax=Nonomuraea sp. NPDC050691 TaxID=3155661 RepID=UPI0033DBD63E
MRPVLALAVATLAAASTLTAPAAAAPTAAAGATARRDLVVAADGTGDHRTVQAAIDAVPAGSSSRVTILVRKGTYREVVTVPANKPNISLVGATGDPRDVVITYDNAASTPKPDGSGTYGTSGSASVVVSGNDFVARNLTFQNAYDERAHGNSQAVAVRTTGDRLIFDNVRFLGNQDTLYANSPSTTTVSRQYYRNCYVEGDVDFIFGRGTAVFDRCTIRSLNRGSSSNNGYVTAASTEIANPYGFLIYRSTLVGDLPAQSAYLGRPWPAGGSTTARGQVLVRESTLGAHVKPAPWTDMSGLSWRDARLSEYRNTGPGAGVNANRPQLTDAQAAALTPQRYLAGPDGWNPLT